MEEIQAYRQHNPRVANTNTTFNLLNRLPGTIATTREVELLEQQISQEEVNRERNNERDREYYQANRERIIERQQQYNQVYYQDNFIGFMYNAMVQRHGR